MRKFLSTSGISNTHAQQISNLMTQRVLEIDRTIKSWNTASKNITIEDKVYPLVQSNPVPADAEKLIEEKACLNSCVAFLMEMIKAKANLIKEEQEKNLSAHERFIEMKKKYDEENLELHRSRLPSNVKPRVTIDWAREQLPDNEWLEYIVCEAKASHLGMAIHSDGTITKLREEAADMTLLKMEEIEISAASRVKKQYPVSITKAVDTKLLFELHKSIAMQHRLFESKVNYYKSKIQTLMDQENNKIDDENNRIVQEAARHNNEVTSKQQILASNFSKDTSEMMTDFMKKKRDEVKRLSALKISISEHPEKDLIDEYYATLDKKDEEAEK